MSDERAVKVISLDTLRDNRIPPGQAPTRKWPVLHAGSTPQVDLSTWSLRLFGLVDSPVQWDWPSFRGLPAADVAADMHCVTRWSRLNMTWHGVLVSEVLKHVAIKREARFVMAHCEEDFTTNLPLDDFLSEDALFAWGADGKDLEPDHGWPLRLVVPKLYAWKSAKWIRGVEFIAHDKPGFWERGGYHMRGDPWTEQRYGW